MLGTDLRKSEVTDFLRLHAEMPSMNFRFQGVQTFPNVVI